MRRFKIALVALGMLGLSGCGAQQALNPPQLVTDRESDLPIQLFMQATILMAKYYGFDTIDYGVVRDRSARAGFNVIPFMDPIATRATPPFGRPLKSNLGAVNAAGTALTGDAFRTWVDSIGGYRTLVKYYVTTGWRASQIVCRNYLLGLDEKNRYLDFLQKEFNIAFGLANTILVLANANGTLRSAFGIAQTGVNEGIDTYQDYRFLTVVDREAARALVEAVQNTYAMDFLNKVDTGKVDNGVSTRILRTAVVEGGTNPQPPGFILFSDAIHVLNTIEYQCTRSGIRFLLNKAIVGKTLERLHIDPVTNAVVFPLATP